MEKKTWEKPEISTGNINSTEITVGSLVDKMTGSDRILIKNAAKQVIFRGYAAAFRDFAGDKERMVANVKIGMETYNRRDKMWDWQRIETLPEEVPVSEFGQYSVGELEHILYTEITLENDFEKAARW